MDGWTEREREREKRPGESVQINHAPDEFTRTRLVVAGDDNRRFGEIEILFLRGKLRRFVGLVVHPGDSNDRRPWTIEQGKKYG